MSNEKTARITVEITPPDAAGEGKISVALDGQMNTLLNGLERLNAHFIEDMIKEIGKEDAMRVYAKVQMDALELAGIDTRKEVKESAKHILAKLVLDSILADEDPAEEEGGAAE